MIVDKPAGRTSHDVVGAMRRLAHTRRVGHAGTLDPMATGVLVLGVNKATRLLHHLVLTDKAYDATIRLGQATVTDDAEGELVSVASATAVTDDAVRAAMVPLSGAIEQVPSSVSAIKVGGQRSYQRVRDGEAVELAARPVTVSRFEALAFRRVGELLDVDVTVECSSGTYVRALARDLGAALGVGGHLTALRRTRVGPFTLDVARTLDDLADARRSGHAPAGRRRAARDGGACRRRRASARALVRQGPRAVRSARHVRSAGPGRQRCRVAHRGRKFSPPSTCVRRSGVRPRDAGRTGRRAHPTAGRAPQRSRTARWQRAINGVAGACAVAGFAGGAGDRQVLHRRRRVVDARGRGSGRDARGRTGRRARSRRVRCLRSS